MSERVLAWGCTTGKRIAVAVVGSAILTVGLAMVVLPGPAVVVIPIGLGVLAMEFAWAQRSLKRLQDGSDAALERLRSLRSQ